ncbi:MAG TPA: PLP-dependent aminotransferase family protein [Rubrivivax sp.]|nr:PLP-dependent aminotransferase family protein [Rubrivivax sp.]
MSTTQAPAITGNLTEQLAARFAARIEQRLLAPGSRLPSVRDCARRHGVSPSTVVGAYDLLQARGLVQARPQRGFFVREPSAPSTPRTPPPAGAVMPLPAPVDATALIRSMFQAQGGRPAPGMGTLPEAWLDAPLLQRALRRVCRQPEAWLRYGDPAGSPRLRQALAQRLADLGVAATPAHIVTTVGATHALDLVSRTLLQPGDAVLVDEPGWAVEYARLTRMGMRLLPVPRIAAAPGGDGGPDLGVMEALARQHRPRLYVTVSVLHNPTGLSLTPAQAHRLLRLAEQHELQIVEDDTYAWLAPPHATRLAQLDGLRRTIYVSGFSKVLTPQWRVGCVAAAPALAERLIDTKLLSSLSTPGPLEDGVALCLEQGLVRRHAERVVALLDAARGRAVRLAEGAGCRFVTPPAGLFGWVDAGHDTEALAQLLLDEGWLIAPGALFHATPRPTTLMRINFATTQEAAFWRSLRQAIAKLGAR